jgi:hypothetical protein
MYANPLSSFKRGAFMIKHIAATAVLSFAFVSGASTAWSAGKANVASLECLRSAGIEITSAAIGEGTSELTLMVQDSEPVSGVCDYYVKRFNYVPNLDGLLVQLEAPKPCLNERVGKRVGMLRWMLPEGLRQNGRLKLIVNGRKAGFITIESGQARHEIPMCVIAQ